MARLSYAIVAVSDMERSVAFYRSLLEINPGYESKEWTQFETGATSFALHAAGAGKAPEPGQHPAGTAWIGFAVDDIAAFHQRAMVRGIRCLQEPTDEGWGINASYADPDGFVFSVAQMAPPSS
jgi:predicted enzyme related to lactoylglutathione lyase